MGKEKLAASQTQAKMDRYTAPLPDDTGRSGQLEVWPGAMWTGLTLQPSFRPYKPPRWH